mgnify:CR=1 FL=1
MYKKFLGLTICLVAACSFVACGDDSSSGSNSKEGFVTNPTDPVKCEFKEADAGLSFTMKITIDNKAEETKEEATTRGTCVKDTCGIFQTNTIGGGYEAHESIMILEEDIPDFSKEDFRNRKNVIKSECDAVNGKTREVLENYQKMMENVYCEIDENEDAHYKHTFTNNEKEASTEYTLDGTTIAIHLVEPIFRDFEKTLCEEKKKAAKDSDAITCTEEFMITDSKVENKDEDSAKELFKRFSENSKKICNSFTKL